MWPTNDSASDGVELHVGQGRLLALGLVVPGTVRATAGAATGLVLHPAGLQSHGTTVARLAIGLAVIAFLTTVAALSLFVVGHSTSLLGVMEQGDFL